VQTTATKISQKHLITLLNYLSTNPDASILYCKSGIIIKVYSDGSYLSVLDAHSQVSDHFYLGDNIAANQDESYQGAIYQEYSIIKSIVASATKCETLILFLNC